MKKINKATLLLGAVSITDVYINAHTFPFEKNKYNEAKQNVIEQLNLAGRHFKSDYFDTKEYEEFAISGSSYIKMTSRDIFMHIKLENKNIPEIHLEITNKNLEDCKFQDTYMVFLNGGNAVILTSVKLNSLDLTYPEYEELCRILHKSFPVFYKESAIEICVNYYKTLKKLYPDTTKVTLKEKSHQNLPCETRLRNYTLNFSIYNHFIFDEHLYNNDSELSTFFANEECIEKMKNTQVNKIKIHYGYTHSFYLFSSDNKREYFERLYKLPLLNVLANWATIRAITFEIDDLSKACKHSLKGKFIISSYNKMKKYLLKIEDLFAEFDGYSTTNNPINYNLIYLYKNAFGEIEHMDRLAKKREQVYGFMSTISSQRIEHSTKFTNAILTIIACTTIFDIVEFNLVNACILFAGLLVVNLIRRFIQNKRIKL